MGKKYWRILINMAQADLTRLVSTLKIAVRPRHRQFASPEGPAGRLRRLRATVTALVKYERIELHEPRADEARGYAERLISDAIRYGDCPKHTMEMADYWLEEKQLVHKLFKVLVPRYQNYDSSFTRMVLAPNKYPGKCSGSAVLELKENPFPPLLTPNKNCAFWLPNVLLNEARKDYHAEKKEQSTKPEES